MEPRTNRPAKAVELLMQYLGKSEDKAYEFESEPDKSQRQEPAADFVYVESDSGKRVAVEFTEFADPKVEEASTLMKAGKRIRKRGPIDVTPMELAGEQLGFMEPARSYPTDFQLFDMFIARKIGKGQLQGTQAHERILLIYDSTLMPEVSFRRYACSLSADQRDGVHRAYVILEQRYLYGLW
jgi:hypothetical protein